MTTPAERRQTVVVLGCGNPSRGDDALGPALMARVEAWMRVHPERPVIAVEDFQLQVEHTLDLKGRDLALFVDATASGQDAVVLRRIRPGADFSFTSHSLSPSALLQAFATLDRGTPPAAFSLAARGCSFGLGHPLSGQGARSLEDAWRILERLLDNPTTGAWEALCAVKAATPRELRQTAPPAPSPSPPV